MDENLHGSSQQPLEQATRKIDMLLSQVAEEINEEEAEEDHFFSLLLGGLQDIKADLVAGLSSLVADARRETRQNRQILEEILKNQASLEKSLKENQLAKTPTTPKRSYAAAAAASTLPTLPPARRFSPPIDSHAVLLRPTRESWLGNTQFSQEEIIKKAKTEVAGLLAADRLRSGYVRLVFDSEKTKKKALSQELREKFKSHVLEQDFPVEVLAVRTSLFNFGTQEGRGKAQAVRGIQESIRRTIPSAEITRASWIHGRKTQETKQRASLVVYFSRKEDQELAVLRGAVLEGRVHTTLLYSSRLRITQCFKCSRWGHTQTTCKAKDTCGYCAGSHNTRDCDVQGQKDKRKCSNCQRQGHASWEKSRCNVWEQRIKEREALRLSLLQQGADIEREFSRRRQEEAGETALPSRKRGRAETIQPEPQQVTQQKRRSGRPKFNEGQVLGTQPLVSSFLGPRSEQDGGTDQGDMQVDG